MSFDDPFRAARLILELRQGGVMAPDVLAAMEKTPRETFVPDDYQDLAYENVETPIDCGQELTRPVVTGLMLQALGADTTCNVLEVGCGNGYQTAVLSKLSRRVFGIDRYRTLVEAAKLNMRALAARNVEIRLTDGLNGWPEAAPFERIILCAAVSTVPHALISQLTIGGVLVAPVDDGEVQSIWRYLKEEDGSLSGKLLVASKFLPVISGTAKEL